MVSAGAAQGASCRWPASSTLYGVQSRHSTPGLQPMTGRREVASRRAASASRQDLAVQCVYTAGPRCTLGETRSLLGSFTSLFHFPHFLKASGSSSCLSISSDSASGNLRNSSYRGWENQSWTCELFPSPNSFSVLPGLFICPPYFFNLCIFYNISHMSFYPYQCILAVPNR